MNAKVADRGLCEAVKPVAGALLEIRDDEVVELALSVTESGV
jgi:hypothetical protein